MTQRSLTTELVYRTREWDPWRDPSVGRMAAWFLLDTLAVGLVGARIERDFVVPAAATFTSLSPGDAAAVIARPGRAQPAGAAGAHAASIHTIDLDDSYLEGVKVHLSASLVPTVLAVGQEVGATGHDLLDAYIRGFEVGALLGHAVVPSHLSRWHPTGTLGVVACAAAAARLYGLDDEQTRSCLALAGDRATGSRYFVLGGDATKPLHAGWSAHDGIAAALMARAGVVGPADFFEGAKGYVETFSDARPMVPDLADRPLILDNSTKFYPAMHGLHAAIELAVDCAGSHPVTGPADISSITAFQCTGRAHMGRNWRPETALAAKLSLPYAVAAALLDGEYTLRQCTEDRLGDPALTQVMDLIEIMPSDELEAEFGARVVTRLRVEFADGTVFDSTFADPRGTPLRPATEEDRQQKVHSLLDTWCSDQEIDELSDAALSLAEAPSLDRLLTGLLAVADKES